jgi:hypothetical protein
MACFTVARRALIAALAYLAGFLLIVLVQFSGRDRFKAQAGALSITGIRLPEGEQGFPLSLNLDFSGIGFSFGRGRPLAVTMADGTGGVLAPLSWTMSERAVSLTLEGGATIVFESDAEGSTFSIHTLFGNSGVRSVSLPYSLSGASFQANLGERLSVRARSGTYTLGLPEGSRLDAERYVLVLGERRNAFSLAAVRKPGRTVSRAEGAAAVPSMPERDWRASLDAWAEHVWSGLSRDRYRPEALGWSAGASVSFSEQALAVLIAEALRRDVYPAIRPMVASLAKARAEGLGWLTAVYLGDIIVKGRALLAADAQAAVRIGARLAAKDPGILLEPDILHFCVDRQPALLEPLLSLAANLDAEGLGIQTAAGILICMADAEGYFPQAENPFARLEQAALAVLEAAIVRAEQGAFLDLGQGQTDAALQLRAGAALIRIGAFREDDTLAGTGRALVAAILSMADQSGFLPERVVLAGGKAAEASGLIPPEAVYGRIYDNAWYPRARSLFREEGRGTWILSCSPRIAVEWGATQAAISAEWPVGATHYMAVFGLKPIVLMRLYEIPYNPDPAFDRYNASGYLYSRADRTLYLKMRHKSEREYVRMTF